MNIECNQEALSDLENAFKFSDAVLRHLTIRINGPITEPSVMMLRQGDKPIVSDTNTPELETNSANSTDEEGEANVAA